MVKNEIGFVPHYIRFPGGSSNTISRKYCQGIMSTLTKEVIEKGINIMIGMEILLMPQEIM